MAEDDTPDDATFEGPFKATNYAPIPEPTREPRYRKELSGQKRVDFDKLVEEAKVLVTTIEDLRVQSGDEAADETMNDTLTHFTEQYKARYPDAAKFVREAFSSVEPQKYDDDEPSTP